MSAKMKQVDVVAMGAAPGPHGVPAGVALLKEKEVQRLTGLSRSWRWRLSRSGKFPMPVKVGARRIAYRADAIQTWLDGLKSQEAA